MSRPVNPKLSAIGLLMGERLSRFLMIGRLMAMLILLILLGSRCWILSGLKSLRLIRIVRPLEILVRKSDSLLMRLMSIRISRIFRRRILLKGGFLMGCLRRLVMTIRPRNRVLMRRLRRIILFLSCLPFLIRLNLGVWRLLLGKVLRMRLCSVDVLLLFRKSILLIMMRLMNVNLIGRRAVLIGNRLSGRSSLACELWLLRNLRCLLRRLGILVNGLGILFLLYYCSCLKILRTMLLSC